MLMAKNVSEYPWLYSIDFFGMLYRHSHLFQDIFSFPLDVFFDTLIIQKHGF